MRFWDSSAIVPLLVYEPTSPALHSILDADTTVAVWWATAVECNSALARREREGLLQADQVAAAQRRLRELQSGWYEVSPSQRLRDAAKRLVSTHDLRASDALQLAAALAATEDEPAALAFVCFDRRLSVAAAREGFTVIP